MHRTMLALIALGAWVSACTPGDADREAASGTEPAAGTTFAAAESLKKQGRLMEAARIYETLARDHESDVEAEIEIAAIDRRMGRPQEAVEVMRDALKRQPDNQRVMMHLAYALVDAKRFEEAVGIFDGIIAANPKDAAAYSGKGMAFDRSGNHLAAQELYSQALKIEPDKLSAQNNLAMSLILNNQLSQAIGMLEALSSLHPDHKTIRRNLALAYGLSGKSEKAFAIDAMDLTPEQARENGRFYSYYAGKRTGRSPLKDSEHISVGFSETADARKAGLSKTDKASMKNTLKELYPDTEKEQQDKPQQEPETQEASKATEEITAPATEFVPGKTVLPTAPGEPVQSQYPRGTRR
jgi:Flp pilus assembly protein TadD